MNLLSAQHVSKSYSHRELFTDLSLDMHAGEKVGLVGPNGAGKSTLLKILAGLETPDEGTRSIRRGARIGYVPQDDIFPAGHTVTQVVLDGLIAETLEEHEKDVRAAISLTQVGFYDHEQRADTLSGGWRKRLSIARELAKEPELLLMDEPTNHLDLPGVIWLERLLRGSAFGYLVATHDRSFLRAVADEIVEINRVYPAGVFRADGGFDSFADKKAAFIEAQERQREAVANRVRIETDWLGHKAQARTRKASSRIEAAADRREQLAELNYRTKQGSAAGIDFAGTGRQTKKLLTIANVSKSIAGRKLFANLELLVSPGVKLGLLGPNGSGKSTFLKIIAKELAPDTGTITHAEGLRIEVFEQGRSSLDQTITLREALCPNGDTVVFRDQPMHVAGWASRFQFHADQLDMEMSALSGGEQARVRIAQLMLRPADLLLLDEPTNDLDIAALELLEENLDEFPGALVIVSHDRDLLDRLCTEFIGLDGLGGSALYGSVNQWLNAYEKANAPSKPAATKSANPTTSKPKKLSYKEQQEVNNMETAILEAEELLQVLKQKVEDAATSSHTVLSEACRAMESAQSKVEQLYARWAELEAKRNAE
ncbi:MAG: ABC-F family ATP-binding cassette domain-containing protein [Zavarzinella sp.]